MNAEKFWKFLKYVLMFAGVAVLIISTILLANSIADANWGLHR